MPKRAAYHHGDLRRTLLDASLALVEEAGIGALSLREVARKAGVSHNAPYHHFPDKAAILAAISIDGFERLGAAMAAARREVKGSDPLGRLQSCGHAYVSFAIAHPAHFRVMFRPELAGCHADVTQAAAPSFDNLVQSVRDCQEAKVAPPGDPMPLVLTCWSAVHGLASLWLDGPLSQDPKGFGRDPQALAEMVSATLARLIVAAASVPWSATRRRRRSS